jgi:hypothetical protein
MRCLLRLGVTVGITLIAVFLLIVGSNRTVVTTSTHIALSSSSSEHLTTIDAALDAAKTSPKPPDDPNLIAQFLWWLNACVSGQLDDIDPGCKEAAYNLSGFSYSADNLGQCAIEGSNAIATGRPQEALSCFGAGAAALWDYWQSHKK